MAQKNISKLYPKIEGDAKFGFKYLSFIKSDTAFAASAGLSGAAVEGQLRYDSSEHNFKFWNGSTDTAVAAAAAAGVGLDQGYDLNPGITVDGTSLTLTGSSPDVLTVIQTANNDGIYISKTGTGSGAALNILNVGTGADIYTTGGYFAVSKAGAVTARDVTCRDITATVNTTSITTDVTDGTAVTINLDTLTSGTGLLLDMNAASTATLLKILVGAVNVVTVSDTGVLTLAGVAEGTSTLTLTTGDLTLTDGDLNITSGQFTMTGDANADVMTVTGAATGNYDIVYLDGTTNTGSGSILKIAQGASTRTGPMIDLNMGTTAVAMEAIDIDCTGGTRTAPVISINSDGTESDFIYLTNGVVFTGNYINMAQTAGAATGNFIFINNDSGTSMEAINIDDDASLVDTILCTTSAAIGAAKAVLHVVSTGTLNATANALLVNWTGVTATNTPYMVKLDSSSKDIAALSIDSDAATDSVVLLQGGGNLADNKAILELTWDGTPANAGTNMLRVDGSGGTNTVKPVLVEIYDDSIAVGLSVSTASIEDMVSLVGMGATGDDKAVLDVTWGAITPGHAGANLVRIDGSAATNTNKPVLLEVYDDSVAVGLVVNTASIEDVVSITGSGNTGANKAVVDINWGAITPNAAGNLLRLDATAATTTSVPICFEIVGAGEVARAIYTDSDATAAHTVQFHGGGALTDGLGVVGITNDGNLATGGNLLNVTVGGTPHTAAAAAEIVSAKDCIALDITTSAATNSAVKITGVGAVANDMALLHVAHGTGAIVAGGSIVRIAGNANAGGATAYGMTINCNATNLEALWVEAGTVLIAEQLTATGGVVTKLGTTADLTVTTPTDAEFSTAFGVANKTKGGFIGVVEDSGSGVAYIAFSDGTTWHFVTGTAAGA